MPREEKPSLGSDLVAARRAYTAAIGRYNAAADRFNEIADEYQRVDAYADPDEAARLRVRLEEARGDADAAREHADELRASMEAVQSRYR